MRDDGPLHRALREAGVTHVKGQPLTFVHGCARGCDTLVDGIAELYRAVLERYPAEWDKYGKRAGPLRNAHMVSLGADICLAFPDPPSRGTADCIEKAWRAGIPVRVYPVKCASA